MPPLPQAAAELFRRALAEDKAGRLPQAEAGYRRVLAVDPAHAAAWHRLGLLARRVGRADLALEYLGRAVALPAAKPDYFVDLGAVLAALGRFDEAETRYRDALGRDPRYPQAHNGLGTVLVRQGRLEEAVEAYATASRLKPDAPEPCYNLAQTLYRLARIDEAAAACRKALRLKPLYLEAQLQMGNIRSAQGRLDEAESCYRAAIRQNPSYAEAHRNLGDAQANLGRFDDAVNSYRTALSLKPDFPSTWNNLGLALIHIGRAEEAQTCYREALRLDPDFLGARINGCMAHLRVIYQSEEEIERVRADYAADLEFACHRPATPGDIGATGDKSPFLLAYQGRSDVELQRTYGRYVAQIMAALHPHWAAPPDTPPPLPGEPIRVGILSSYFYSHSNWKIPIKGWVQGLDRRKYQIFGYHVGAIEDGETALARTLCHRFVHGLASLERWAEAIRADRLHVLLIPGIGMDAQTARLAALRLAPVQATSWGHPDTSGLPTIDDYLSSDLMEPPEAEQHYTERLVRLPNLSIWYEPPAPTPVPLSRAELGIPAGAVLYWCCQSLYKYLPQFDPVFARIALLVPEARFLFITYPFGDRVTAIFRERLIAAFAAAGLEAGRYCLFVPPMDISRFAAISRLADLFLDSIGWSGCNSTLEALAVDLPVVTLAGALMRGRHSSAILTMLGLPELVAADADAFVDLAAALGRDPARRQELSSRIARTKHRLYRDQAAIDGLAAYLDEAAHRRRRAGA
jgi:protein O-GlcNAc transferase